MDTQFIMLAWLVSQLVLNNIWLWQDYSWVVPHTCWGCTHCKRCVERWSKVARQWCNIFFLQIELKMKSFLVNPKTPRDLCEKNDVRAVWQPGGGMPVWWSFATQVGLRPSYSRSPPHYVRPLWSHGCRTWPTPMQSLLEHDSSLAIGSSPSLRVEDLPPGT